MRFATLFALAAPALVAADIGLGHGHGNSNLNKRHHPNRDFSPRDDAHITLHQNKKRFSGCRATFYDVGLGACGNHNSRGDFIVALNTHQYGSGYPGPQCGKGINIHYKGKTAHAVIQDECPGCPFGALDMSRGLFDFFEDESAGVFTMSWEFADGSGGGSSPPKKPDPKPDPPKPKPTHEKPKPTTHSTKKPDPTTTEDKPDPTPTKAKTNDDKKDDNKDDDDKKSSSTEEPKKSSTESKPTATPTATPTPGGGNLDSIAEAMERLGQLVIRGQQLGAQ